MARAYLFEINDRFTRSRFVSSITPFLDDVKTNRGIYAYKIICDETNNTGYVIDTNQFVAAIMIKPARIAEFITLNFMAVGTSVSFDEVYQA